MGILIGEERLIKSKIVFWSIALQENISASNDLVIKITNTCVGNDFVFGNIIEFDRIFGNEITKINGEVMISYSKTKPHERIKPIPMMLDIVYNERKIK